MGKRGHDPAGKILGLLAFIDAHEEAVRADLLRAGFRFSQLGSPELPWADVAAIINYADHTTAVYRSVNGHNWSIETALAAAHFDQLNALLWQNSGGKKRKPKPFPRPKALEAKPEEEKTLGKASEITDIRKFLERKNGR